MHEFKIGMRVRILADKQFPHLVGAVGEITRRQDHNGKEAWHVDIPWHKGQSWNFAWAMEPIRDDYDGRTACAWSELWMPGKVKA